jgi:hypothetical protein
MSRVRTRRNSKEEAAGWAAAATAGAAAAGSVGAVAAAKEVVDSVAVVGK